MSEVADFKPGLEGVVAVGRRSPSRIGRGRGAPVPRRRHRGARRSRPYEEVWGLLVDEIWTGVLPEPDPYEPAALTGTHRPTRRPRSHGSAGLWELGKAQRDLGRAGTRRPRQAVRAVDVDRRAVGTRSRTAMQSRSVPDDVVAAGRTAAEQVPPRWTGEADAKAVRPSTRTRFARRSTGLNASTFTARVTASTGADRGAALVGCIGDALRPAPRRGTCHVIRCSTRSAHWGTRRSGSGPALRGKRIMGFGHRVYRAEDLDARHPSRTARELGLVADRRRRAARVGSTLGVKSAPPRAGAHDECRVLGGARSRRRGHTAAR